ncbi:MAG TPA: MFS transporter [Dermatophilaceae bacterium]|nr:MFS transporter [Dermatophilaceae bacterium]
MTARLPEGHGRTQTDRTDWAVVWVALGAGILAAVQVGKAIVGLPAVRADLGMSLTLAGVLLSAYTYVGAVLGGVAGGIVDRIGQGRVLVAAMAALALASGLGAASPAVVMLVFSRVLEGFGFMACVVAAPALVSRASGGAQRNLTMGLWGVYMPAGQLLAMIVGPAILASLGWRGFWGVNAAVVGGYAVVVAVIVGRSGMADSLRRGTGRQPGATRGETPGWAGLRPVLPLALTFGLYSLQYLAVVGFLPTIYQANGLTASHAAFLTGVVIFGNIVGNVVAGALVHRGVAPGTLAVLALAVMGVCAVPIYAGWAPFPLAFAAAVCFTTFGGLLPASVFAAVPRMAPSPALTGPANGLVVQISNTGSIIGPPLVAALASMVGGWSMSPLVLSTAAVLGIWAALVVRRRAGQPVQS